MFLNKQKDKCKTVAKGKYKKGVFITWELKLKIMYSRNTSCFATGK